MNEKNQSLPVVTEENALSQITVDLAGVKWTLYRIDAEALIRDIDWAERLGYERPRDIRELIKRLATDGSLGKVTCRTVRHPGSKEANEFYLTKAQAIKVAAKSKTKFADELLDHVIQVFLIATGHAPAAVTAPTDRWTAGDGDALDMVEQMVKAMKAERRRVNELAAQQSALIADQAELAKTQALQAVQVDATKAKVDQLLVAQQAAELELRTPQSPVMTLPELDRKFDTIRIVRAYGMATGDYRGGFNTIYGLHRDLFHIDLKARAKIQGVSPAVIAEQLGCWDRLHAIAVKYLCPLTAQALANKERAFNA